MRTWLAVPRAPVSMSNSAGGDCHQCNVWTVGGVPLAAMPTDRGILLFHREAMMRGPENQLDHRCFLIAREVIDYMGGGWHAEGAPVSDQRARAAGSTFSRKHDRIVRNFERGFVK